jgi:hypothetical protein
VIAAGPQAEVYEVLGVNGGSEVFGCAFGRSPYVLGLPFAGSATGGGGIDREVLAGQVVAYEESSSKRFQVVVRDLRTGRVLHRVPTGTPSAPPLEVGVGPTPEIVVKSNGAVAWITDNLALVKPQSDYFEVRALDKMGGRVLAAGTDVDPHSLALVGSILYWTEGGKPFSTTLN